MVLWVAFFTSIEKCCLCMPRYPITIYNMQKNKMERLILFVFSRFFFLGGHFEHFNCPSFVLTKKSLIPLQPHSLIRVLLSY